MNHISRHYLHTFKFCVCFLSSLKIIFKFYKSDRRISKKKLEPGYGIDDKDL